MVVVTTSSSDLSPLNTQLLDLKLDLNSVLVQLQKTSKVEVILKTDPVSDVRKCKSPLTTSETVKPKIGSLSPTFIPLELQTGSPARNSSDSSLLSPGSKGLQSPSSSASGDDSKLAVDGNNIMASSAL